MMPSASASAARAAPPDTLEALPNAVVVFDASAVLPTLAPRQSDASEAAERSFAISTELHRDLVASLRLVEANAHARTLLGAASLEECAARLAQEPTLEPFATIKSMVTMAAVRDETRGTFAVTRPLSADVRGECLVQYVVADGDGSPDWSHVIIVVTELGTSARTLVPPDANRDLEQEILARANVLVWKATVQRVDGQFRWKFEMPATAVTNRLFHLVTSPETGSLWSPERTPDIPAMNERSTRAMLEGATGYQQEFRVEVDGATVWLAEDVAIQRLGENEWSLVGVASDVTARREAEAAHERSAAQLRNLLERADCMLWQARVTETGDTYHWALTVMRSGLQRRMFGDRGGFEYCNVTGGGGTTLFGAHEIPEAEKKDARGVAALRSGAPGYQHEFRVVTPDQTYWVQEEVTISPVAPGVFDLVGVIFDVTRRREAEEESRRSSAHIQQLLERADCMLWQARVQRINGEHHWSFTLPPSGLTRTLFGDRKPGTRGGITGKSVSSIYGGYPALEQEEMDRRSLRALERGQSGYQQEFQVQAADQLFWMQEQVSITRVGPDQWDLVGVVFDITARKQAERATRRTQAQLHQMLERADCMLWLAHVIASPRGYDWSFDIPASALRHRLWGPEAPVADAQGQRGTELYGQGEIRDRATMQDNATRALRDGASFYENEFQVASPTGNIWLHEHVSITPTTPGNWHLVGVVIDVTARREAEAARLATEHRLQQLLASVDCLIWEGRVRERENGHLSWAVYIPNSRLYRQLFECDPDPVRTRFWADLKIPELEQMHARSTHALRNGHAGYAQEFSVVTDHRTFWLNEQVVIHPSTPGEWQLIGVVTDVTARRAAETALAAETERLSVTLRAMSEGVVTTDMYGRVQFLNRGATELTGCGAAEAVGREITRLCRFINSRNGIPYRLPLDVVLEEGGTIDLPLNTALMQPEGRNCLVAGRCAPVHDAVGRIIGAVLVLDDITERHRLDEHLQRASKLESVGILAGGIAHDFNNILTAIMGNLSLGLMDVPDSSPAHQILHDAHAASLRARELTQQLLTFAKGGDPVRTAVHLPDIITEVARFALHGSAIGREFDLPPDLWSADADKGQFGQIVQNLVINAVQAMNGSGQIRIAASNTPVKDGSPLPLPPGDYVRVTVADNGPGIAAEDLDRIFDPYFTTKKHGHGLGLATVYSIIRRHGGHIEVDSEVGRGTTFTIWLPALPEKRVAPPVPGKALQNSLHGRVLFMDDEEPIRKLGGALLRRLGLDVVLAIDGAEAIRLYQEARDAGRPFDVVVMDLTVPGGMGGREAVAQLRQIDPAVRAVVSSGYSSDPVMANHRAFGFCGVVAKPYQFEQFIDVLRAALAGGRT